MPVDHSSISKKKSKGKLFQCTGYPGCSMVFTRSEHLARHIRKHTGERPFQCDFCMKKFSRLDNLRQHKQTVHQYQINTTTTTNPAVPQLLQQQQQQLPSADMIIHQQISNENDPLLNHPHHIHNIQQHQIPMYLPNKQQQQPQPQQLIPMGMSVQAINTNQQPQSNTLKYYSNSTDLNPKTPSNNLQNQANLTNSGTKINSLASPPSSVSPHINNQLKNSMLPPPRRNSLLQQPRGYSEFRPTLSNKPVPIIIENADSSSSNSNTASPGLINSNSNNSSSSANAITPSTGTRSIMDISPLPNSAMTAAYQQAAIKRNPPTTNNSLSLYAASSNFSSPSVSPSVMGFSDSPSPYILNFGLASKPTTSNTATQQPNQQSNHPQPQPLSPRYFMNGSNTITPTTVQFDFQNNPYLSPVYYPRISNPISSNLHYQNSYSQQQQQQAQSQQPLIYHTTSIYAPSIPNSTLNTPTIASYQIPSAIPDKSRPENISIATTMTTDSTSNDTVSTMATTVATAPETKLSFADRTTVIKQEDLLKDDDTSALSTNADSSKMKSPLLTLSPSLESSSETKRPCLSNLLNG